MTTPRIVVEQVPNDLIRTFHVNAYIVTERYYRTRSMRDQLDKIGEPDYTDKPPNAYTVQTVRAFYSIDVVIEVSLDVYEVRITISPAFDWSEIEPQVISLIARRMNWSDFDLHTRGDGHVQYDYAWSSRNLTLEDDVE